MCTHIHTHARSQTVTHTCSRTHIYSHVYTYTHTLAQSHSLAHTHTLIHTHVYTFSRTHTHVHTNVSTRTHTRTFTLILRLTHTNARTPTDAHARAPSAWLTPPTLYGVPVPGSEAGSAPPSGAVGAAPCEPRPCPGRGLPAAHTALCPLHPAVASSEAETVSARG